MNPEKKYLFKLIWKYSKEELIDHYKQCFLKHYIDQDYLDRAVDIIHNEKIAFIDPYIDTNYSKLYIKNLEFLVNFEFYQIYEEPDHTMTHATPEEEKLFKLCYKLAEL